MSDIEWSAWYRANTANPFAHLCCYDDRSIYWPAANWGCGFVAGMRYALKVADDHAYHGYGVMR